MSKNIKKTNHIFEETQRESIINRPHNLFGSVKPIPKERFCISEESIEFKDSIIIPALLKIFMEAIDNPIDVAIKNNRKIKIDVKVNKDSISVKDDGTGIPNIKDELNEYLAFKAFCKYNTSSNYQEFKNQGQKGVNGLGIKGSNTLSTEFIAINDDGKTKIKIVSTENNLNHKITELKSNGSSGVEVTFKPDFKIIDAKEIDDEHINRMREYVLMQSLTYPNITFTFNGKRLNYNGKKFVNLFDKVSILEEFDDYFLAVTTNEFDDFKQISYVNGLETSKGGTHINYLVDNIVSPIREKLLKKYKTIKPADIKNKLQIILVAKNVRDIDWDGQTKESITSPNKYWIEYFKELDFIKLSNKILKTPEIIDPITEVYKIKEEFKKRQELKQLDKVVKKIKSDKYTRAIGSNELLLICEGASAKNGILPGLGRDGIAYYELKGKPLNVHEVTSTKFTENKELSELYQIIKNEGFKKIGFASDADLDGDAISGLLIAFFNKYLKDELKNGNVFRFQTPVMALLDKYKKPVEWSYNIKDKLIQKAGTSFKYFKGFGGYTPQQLEIIIQKDGLENMLMPLEFDNNAEESIDDWYSNKKTDTRKNFIMNNDFDLIKI